MKVNDWLRLIAGVFVLLPVVLGATVIRRGITLPHSLR